MDPNVLAQVQLARIYFAPTIILACLLDYAIGDPETWPHPVRGMGYLISKAEKLLLNPDQPDRIKKRLGFIPALVIPAGLAIITRVCLWTLFNLNSVVYLISRLIFLTWFLALGQLVREGLKIEQSLKRDSLGYSRQLLSRIVGRDTKLLMSRQIITATVETIAENFTDGIVAPLFFFWLFDLPGLVFYKAVNTLDSMLGYKNERYRDFGYASAKLDDILNIIPARLAALVMLIVGGILTGHPLQGAKVYWRDRYAHSSPNSAHTEAVMAGLLGIRLGGPSSYHGRLVDKPYIGFNSRSPESRDIRKACLIVTCSTLITALLLALLRTFVY
ncbi:MAG: adenosylcobinamide-phosphate synthase CbiB [Eubacteriales bacterium]|nr:adenosylcobinamide-phosphate synthase CbiB [Eubacteriales bacterium]